MQAIPSMITLATTLGPVHCNTINLLTFVYIGKCTMSYIILLVLYKKTMLKQCMANKNEYDYNTMANRQKNNLLHVLI